MTWLNVPPFAIEEAVARGQDVYEVLVSQWGISPGGDLQWPPAGAPSLRASLAGIAIGPQSQVDRCWLSYSLQKNQTNPGPETGLTNRLRRLSVDTPLIFGQPSAPDTLNAPGTTNDPLLTQVQLGSLYVFAMADQTGVIAPNLIQFNYPTSQTETTVNPSTFTDVNGVVRAWGSALGGRMDPLLHLQLFLKAPVAYAPQKRFPQQLQQTVFPAGQGTEQLIASIPTFGRKTVHIMMISSNAANSFRIGALRGLQQLAGMQEQPVDQTPAGAIAANTPVILSNCVSGNNVQADYINLYANIQAGGVPSVTWQLTAYD